MEKFELTEDKRIAVVLAKSFPEGIEQAFQKIHQQFAERSERLFFGISRPGNDGRIIYKAGAELIGNERAETFGMEEFVIKKGDYYSVLISDFMKDVSVIGTTFAKLIDQPDIDPEGYCVEWYLNEKDVRCMVEIQP